MPEQSLRAVLLPLIEGREVEGAAEALAAADPSGAEEVLMHLVRLGRTGAPATPGVDELLAWAGGEGEQSPVADSLLLAEMLEGALEQGDVGAGLALAAAGRGGEATNPWPAHYLGGPWHVILDLDEDQRLVAFFEGDAPLPRSISLAGLQEVPVTGDPTILGPAEALLGAPPEFNPWPELFVRTDKHDLERLARGPA